MYKLDIDLKSYIPYAIEAYTAVFGSEYADYISEKLSKTVLLYYNYVEGLEEYVNFLKDCKKHKLACRFLEEIGEKVPENIKENYTIPFDFETENTLERWITAYECFDQTDDEDIPILFFNKKFDQADTNK